MKKNTKNCQIRPKLKLEVELALQNSFALTIVTPQTGVKTADEC